MEVLVRLKTVVAESAEAFSPAQVRARSFFRELVCHMRLSECAEWPRAQPFGPLHLFDVFWVSKALHPIQQKCHCRVPHGAKLLAFDFDSASSAHEKAKLCYRLLQQYPVAQSLHGCTTIC